MRLPLCVDLDGTLVRTDLLYETLLAALRRRPWIVLALPFWLLAGRAHLKARLVEAAGDGVDIAALPLTEDLVDYLRSERQAGRRIELVSASDRRAVERVAARVGLFDAVFGSDGDTNLKGPVKARALVERHPEGFVYAGDARADLAVWERAAGAIPVNAALARRDEVAARAPIEAEFGTPPRLGRALFKALRPHQWAKNALVLLPLLLTRSYELPAVLVAALATIALFSLAASGTYLLNDLLDLSADRTHPSKRRPAAGLGCPADPDRPGAVAAADRRRPGRDPAGRSRRVPGPGGLSRADARLLVRPEDPAGGRRADPRLAVHPAAAGRPPAGRRRRAGLAAGVLHGVLHQPRPGEAADRGAWPGGTRRGLDSRPRATTPATGRSCWHSA